MPFVFDLWGFQQEQLGGRKTVSGREGRKEGAREGGREGTMGGWLLEDFPLFLSAHVHLSSLPPSLPSSLPQADGALAAGVRFGYYKAHLLHVHMDDDISGRALRAEEGRRVVRRMRVGGREGGKRKGRGGR